MVLQWCPFSFPGWKKEQGKRVRFNYLPSTMPRASSKKSAISNSTAVNVAGDLYRSASNKAISKELERIDHLFYTYANRSLGMIDPDGIVSLCSDLEVDHTNVRVLMLAWKMQAEKQGYFTLFRIHHDLREMLDSLFQGNAASLLIIPAPYKSEIEEWRKGLKAQKCDTITKLKKALPELEKEVRRTSNFADFYEYAFRYCLTEDRQKSIDIESICQLLDLVLGSQFRAHVDYFTDFLEAQTDYKVINKDQWTGFYRFCIEVNFPDFSNYDADAAWPLILDNFVDWMKAKQT